MITESEARDLLQRAAATIDVPAAPAVVDPHRRPWAIPLVAAAAVAAAVVAGVLVVHRTGDPGPPIVVDPLIATATPTSLMPSGRIPSVFGYDARSARRLLEARGFEVAVREEEKCAAAGRAERTEPAAGERAETGAPVTLVVTRPPALAFCAAEDDLAWQVLDYANRRGGPPPALSPQPHAYLNGKSVPLTGGDDSALGAVAALMRRTDLPNFVFHDPSLFVQSLPRPRECGALTFPDNPLPESLRTRPTYSISFVVPFNGAADPCYRIDVFKTDGLIDTISVRIPVRFLETGQPVPPKPDPAGVGARFLAFARHDVTDYRPAATVRLYLGNRFIEALTGSERTRRSAFRMCLTDMDPSCSVSAVRTLQRTRYQPVLVDLHGSCVREDAPALEAATTGGTHRVMWGLAEPATCSSDYVVELWYDDDNRVTAVNLLLGDP